MLRNPLVVAILSSIAIAVAACASVDPDPANDPVGLHVKGLVNNYRAAVGLPAVTLDAKLSKGWSPA